MMVTNQERVREFRGKSMQIYGGGTFTAVNLHVHVVNFTIDALATVHATLEGEKFDYEGMAALKRHTFVELCKLNYQTSFLSARLILTWIRTRNETTFACEQLSDSSIYKTF